MLSETVLIAAITAITGLGGAAIGAFVSIRVASNQNKAELSRSVLAKCYEARSCAYAGVFDADAEFQRNPTPAAMIDLISVVNRACVVASPETTVALQRYLDLATKRDTEDFRSARATMTVQMQADLRVFDSPAILETDFWAGSRTGNEKNKRKNHKKPKNGVPLNG